MSDLASAIAQLSNTGLEAYLVSSGTPVSISTGQVGGVPYTTSSVGTAVAPGAFSTTTLILLAVAAVAIYFVLRR